MANILIIEDEININDLIRKNLTLVGHNCYTAFDGITGLELCKNLRLDLVILDVMLPGKSGFEIIEQIGNVPVIFVTAKTSLTDKLKGLNLGAEDYIVKPFEMQELLARVAVILRRSKKYETAITFDNVSVDFSGRKAYLNQKEVDLTPKEFSLLEVLILNRNIALSRDKLLNLVWSFDYEGDTRTVDVHIQKIRQKLDMKDRIKTINKFGYRFDL